MLSQFLVVYEIIALNDIYNHDWFAQSQIKNDINKFK